jgi:Uma2 family endonuclease
MASALPRPLLEIKYEEAARAYLRSLPLAHFMEAKAQARQRRITLASLELVETRRSDLHVFNEMLVQYPLPRTDKLGQIVPDNMVVLSTQPIRADTSFNLPLEPDGPFWVMEYVSKNNKRKDYEKSFQKYEQELKVPYYLLFYPDNPEVSLFRLKGKKHISVKPNRQERYPLPELELEVSLLDGWVRYWYQGELLPLPADLQHELAEARQQAAEARAQAAEAQRRADKAAERAAAEQRRADDLQRRVAEEQHARRTLEEELARLRAQTGHPSPRRKNGG